MATTTPTLSSPGIGSGLDVNGIVDKLMAVEQLPLQQLQKQEAVDQAKITAYGSLKSAVAAMQNAALALTKPDAFGAIAATSSDLSSVGATVSGKPATGTYSVNVNYLAQAQKLSSTGFASTTTSVGQGTLTFDFGTFAAGAFSSSGTVKSVIIGAGQDSLAGIRDAVNAANIGVTASIVNDGSAAGNHLVFTSASGAAKSIKLTVADSDGNHTDMAGLSQLAYDPTAVAGAGKNLTEKVQAQDAQLTIDGIAITSATNSITGAIDGLSLNVSKMTTTPVTLSVTRTTSAVSGSINAFVKAYNDFNATIGTLTKYDPAKNQASTLTGDSTVRSIQNQLRSLLGGKLSTGKYTMLSSVGISFQADGTLKLDQTKLDAALSSSPSDVAQLFAQSLTGTDSLVSATGATSKTVPGTYGLNVSQIATHGAIVGGATPSLTVTSGANDVSVTLDGLTSTITIPAGTYASLATLASAVQSSINAGSTFSAASSGVTVSVVNNAGVNQLQIMSNKYGAASKVDITGPNANVILGGAGTGTTTAGVDAAGTLGGLVLGASGQVLSAPAGSALDGVKVTVNGGGTGARGTVTYYAGFASRLNDLLTSVLDDTQGAIASRTQGLQSELKDIGKRRDALNVHLGLVEKTYRQQFTALDSMLASLQAQSAQLTQQLASLPKITGTVGSSSNS